MPSKFLPRDRAWGTRYDRLGTSPPSSPTLQRSATENVHSSTIPPSSPRELQHNAEDMPGFEGPAAQKSDLRDPTPHDASVFVGSLPASVDYIELSQRLREHLSAYPQIKGIKVVRDSRGGVCAFVQCDTPRQAGELLKCLQAQPPQPFLGRFLRFEPAKAYRTLLLSYRAPVGFASAHTEVLSDGHSATKLRLAYAMRIFRPRNAKYLGLVYDGDATKFSATTAIESTGNTQHDRFLGEGFLLDPLRYDGETLQALATAFGPLESFEEYAAGPYPSPHDALRSPEMAQGVWEVKWKDREDSVAALLTLRRVPHLSVSWAHHPPSNASSTRIRQPALVMPTSPGDPTNARTSSDDRGGNDCNPAVQLARVALPIVQVPPSTPSRAPCPVSPIVISPIAPGWSTMTSPTLDRGTDATRWADQMADLDFSTNGAFPSQPALHTSTPVLRSHHAFASSPLSQEPNELFQPVDQFADSYAQSLRQTGVRFPPTEMNRVSVAGPAAREPPGSPGIAGAQRMWADHAAPPPFLRDGPRELDPTTVFVGGLEASGPDAWDENKLRHTFGRFGNIENIHMVVPLNKRSAFAFIKFANDVSASRAVREEHNRIYGGRPIRVQLRERNGAPRGFWRPGRGRGRGLSFGPPHVRQEPIPSGAVVPGAADPCADMLLDSRVSGMGYSGPPQGPMSMSPSRDPFANAQPTGLPAYERVWQEGFSNSFSSLSSDTTKVPSVNYAMSHGPASTTASLTPPPSIVSTSTSASSTMPAPYPMNMGYLPPQPWVQSYPAAYHYPIPFVPGYGYPGYPYAPVHAMAPAFLPPRDPNAPPPSNPTSSQWTAMASFENSAKVISGPASAPLSHSTQPPLRPTGFIQNEHGTLIPVYQREALDEYMANAHGHQPSSPAITGAPPQSVPRPGSAHRPPDGVVWQQPPLAMYPGSYPVHVQSVGSMPVPPAHPPTPHGPRYWMPGAVPYGVPGYHPQNHHVVPGPMMHVAPSPVNPQLEAHIPGGHVQPHLVQRNRHLPALGNRRGHLQAHTGPGISRPPSAAAGDRASLAMQDAGRNVRSRGHSVDPKDRIRC
ncbi:hypothetical protein K466DRAFT_354209 [Polyporus arcularius HHB13444]|uniref:RRM domain-containing protein n=1 Tax=Polyporus arcularius HHB13444 TaxID=1314778 RepID=A0A5C3Q2I3_9APHY|nr:hypothetical protein K466DRAFT_354209 [Polyporus arcularius HHB13444]